MTTSPHAARPGEPIDYGDRYFALGAMRHPQHLVCVGPCEGTGVFPVYMRKGDHRPFEPMMVATEDETDPAVAALWEAAEMVEPAHDGWHFVTCDQCGGSGIDGAPA